MDAVLYIVRHGETRWNQQDRMQGYLDSPLTDKGKSQAANMGDILKAALPGDQAVAIHCSPQGRALETAEIICERLRRDFSACKIDDRLREATWGVWDGMTLDEIEAHTPGALAARATDRWNYAPPDGESYAMVGERAGAWLRSVGEGTHVVVSHGITGRLLRGLYMEMAKDEMGLLDQPQDAVYRLDAGVMTRLER
ncbi:MAG: histidine phosphatase family protein [Rhodospirillaceae bacterium]|nr:histidine phosphatase family protein [Rhodospirillaceae bacterium]MBT4118195.1 histidine phosphatase family protein [Rhodospirillaceae bacterium]MBT4747765.1 histidine phosphatase family protein [Rhodospirillaceae bacterium]MBT5180302.1 histidine phosphatase family protein [Rhodospirillaceae bacterium]MBT6859819.1 histidine phosphatase family protein [Rhodospirillaceae bacterium]